MTIQLSNMTNGPGSACRTSKLTEEQAQAILDAPSDGAANRLAMQFGVSSAAAMAIRRRRSWPHLKRTARNDSSHGQQGESHRRAKLTEEQAQKIVDAAGADEAVAIGLSFGLTSAYAMQIFRRRSWKHLKRSADASQS